MQVKVTTVGAKELLRRTSHIRVSFGAAIASDNMERVVLKRVLKRFDEAVAQDGSPWPELAEATVLRKARGGYPKPDQPLYRTGALRKSIGVIKGRADGLLYMNTGLGFRIGVRSEDISLYARLHNYGYGQKLRKFLGLARSDIPSVRGVARRNMERIVAGGLP